MVAYSFKQRFADPILAGTKRQTIRADRKRHARPGEELQLYVGMRTRSCRLLMRARCIAVQPITIIFSDDPVLETVYLSGASWLGALDSFARADGFTDWTDLKRFWRAEHPGVDEFDGVMISWEPKP